MSIHKYYIIQDDGTINRVNSHCPRCGPGYFMADHYDRNSCGNCGYTEFKKKPIRKPKEEKAEAPVQSKSGKQEPQKGKKKRKK